MMTFKTIIFITGMLIFGVLFALAACKLIKEVDWEGFAGLPASFLLLTFAGLSATCFVMILVRFYTATS